MKKLIAGNWKMNGSRESVRILMQGISAGLWADPGLAKACDVAVFPPFIHILETGRLIREDGQPVALGAQDCSAHGNGAYTGEVSAAMLADYGCRYVILGHSERRQYHGETDALVAAKATAAHAAGLVAIVCVGETEKEREDGKAEDIVGGQISGSLPEGANAGNTVIAYEPVWAIGTGKTATPGDVGAMHGFIREKLQERLADFQKVRILYGGSMKPENAKELLATPDVDGGLIGGASLKAESLLEIAAAAL